MCKFLTRTWYLALVGVFFYSTYGFSNWFTAQRENVPEIIFSWEYQIPFLAWTIIPYWSLNLLYALAFYLCRTSQELHRYILQLILAQCLAVIGFLCFPLQFSWEKPVTEGVLGQLFSSLAAFDQPYNQAPSLHIILTIVVGAFYWRYLSKKWHLPLLIWLSLIAVSILTTYQHHFIDLPTGALIGYLIIWAFPYESTTPLNVEKKESNQKRRKLASYYFLAGFIIALFAFLNGAWLWVLWISVALWLVAFAYQYSGVKVFQKNQYGKLSVPAFLLLLPYLIGVRINIGIWLFGKQKAVVVTDNLFIGSITATKKFPVVVDLCAEYPSVNVKKYCAIPMLDLVAPPAPDLVNAAVCIQQSLQQGENVLVCCALGYGRSAAAILVWLVIFGDCKTLEQAIERLRLARPEMVLSEESRLSILSAIEDLQKTSRN